MSKNAHACAGVGFFLRSAPLKGWRYAAVMHEWRFSCAHSLLYKSNKSWVIV
ncbi:hypothetical protein C4J86_2555 [Pseudomonas sp. R2-7-07]|nr:hypothetical protein C4J86_2555 [Pseudomonas sp. R2-7-07]